MIVCCGEIQLEYDRQLRTVEIPRSRSERAGTSSSHKSWVRFGYQRFASRISWEYSANGTAWSAELGCIDEHLCTLADEYIHITTGSDIRYGQLCWVTSPCSFSKSDLNCVTPKK